MSSKTIVSVAAAVLVGSAGLAAAQQAQPLPDAAKVRAEIDGAVEALRKDVRAGKAEILGKTMALDATQAAAFWPIYKKYETELQALGDERLAILQDLSEHFDTLNDAQAKGLIDRQLAFEEKRLALVRKYKNEMMQALPAKTVARFLQVENRLGKLVDLAVATETPLVY